MFDIGWPELLMVAMVMILVVGPKDLPQMLRAFGRTVKKYRGMAREFQNQFNDALEEAELDELRNVASDAKKLNPMNHIKDAVNPLKEAGQDVADSLNDAAPVKPWTPKPEEISDAARAFGEKTKAQKATTAKSATSTKTATTAKKTTTARKTTGSSTKSVTKSPAKRQTKASAAKAKTTGKTETQKAATTKSAAPKTAKVTTTTTARKPAARKQAAKKPAASASAQAKRTTTKKSAAKSAAPKASDK